MIFVYAQASEALLLFPLARLIKTAMEEHLRTTRRLQEGKERQHSFRCRGNNSFDFVLSLNHLGPSWVMFLGQTLTILRCFEVVMIETSQSWKAPFRG